MSLEPITPQKNIPLGITWGFALMGCGFSLGWVGVHSVMIGWAWWHEAGAFLPVLVGLLLFFAGLPLLFWGAARIVETFKPPDPDQDLIV